MPYRMNITEYERNNDECSYPFCPNIGVKYHLIPHRDLFQKAYVTVFQMEAG